MAMSVQIVCSKCGSRALNSGVETSDGPICGECKIATIARVASSVAESTGTSGALSSKYWSIERRGYEEGDMTTLKTHKITWAVSELDAMRRRSLFAALTWCVLSVSGFFAIHFFAIPMHPVLLGLLVFAICVYFVSFKRSKYNRELTSSELVKVKRENGLEWEKHMWIKDDIYKTLLMACIYNNSLLFGGGKLHATLLNITKHDVQYPLVYGNKLKLMARGDARIDYREFGFSSSEEYAVAEEAAKYASDHSSFTFEHSKKKISKETVGLLNDESNLGQLVTAIDRSRYFALAIYVLKGSNLQYWTPILTEEERQLGYRLACELISD